MLPPPVVTKSMPSRIPPHRKQKNFLCLFFNPEDVDNMWDFRIWTDQGGD
jgi:hypothetical protein